MMGRVTCLPGQSIHMSRHRVTLLQRASKPPSLSSGCRSSSFSMIKGGTKASRAAYLRMDVKRIKGGDVLVEGALAMQLSTSHHVSSSKH